MGVINQLLLAFFFMSQLERFGSGAVQITIDPTKTIASMTKSVQLSCLPDRLDEDKKEVIHIELSRNGQAPLVFARQCGNAIFGHNSSNKFQGFGNIDKDPNQSYLNVSLLNPESQDTGIYTCTLYYIDKEGHMKMETASGNLLVENIDVKSIEKILNQMRDRITTLEKKNKALQEKVFYNVAFMATNKQRFTLSNGAVVIFSHIIWSTGTGYDDKTGVFTAPVPGLYSFHAVVRSESKCHLPLVLMAKERILSKLYSYFETSWGQASNSAVVNLEVGDKVYVTVLAGHDGCAIHNDQYYSVFSGHLVKIL